MIQIKKTILTLVALLAISTGAWAQGYYINIHFDPVYNPEFTSFMCDVMGPDMPNGTLNLSVDGVSKGSFRVDNGMCSSQIHSLDAGDHTWYAEFTPEGGGEKSTEQRSFTIDQGFAYVYIDDPEQSSIEMGVGESRYFRGHVDGPESSEVNISSSNDNVAKFRASSSYSYGFEGYIDAVGAGTATITVSFAGNKNYKAAESKTLTVTVLAPAASGPEVAWDKATKTGTFTMPGGNVTLEPEYYPQAALTEAPTAINDVPATTDGAIVKAGTVANIGSTENAQGTVMYYVSQTALDDAALLALAADQWTADVPTAEKLTKGQAYVYYYVRGNDSDTDEENFSDGDILAANALTVTIAAEPTYAVTFNAANANTIEAGKATVTVGGTDKTVTEGKLQGVKMGSEVKVKANTGYKFRKVEVKKKAAAADIVWDVTNVTDLQVEGDYLSYTKEGIKLSGNAEQVQAEWNNSAYLGTPGMEFITMESGGFTFTAPTGKKFTKIEMKAVGSSGWAQENLGTGWAYNTGTVTWNGSAASTVKLLKDADMFSGDFISSIAFYLSE